MLFYHNASPCKSLAQGDQVIMHFLCKWEIWTEFANGSGAQNLNWGTGDFDGNGEYMDMRSSTNYLGFFLATKMVVPLERPQIAILTLNRKMQFPLFNCGQYFYESSIYPQGIYPQVPRGLFG